MLLEVRNLSVSYGKVAAVNDVSLHVEEGSVATVLGANGAGKTSLLNAIMGVTRAQGTLRFAGQTISGWSSARRVSAGMALVPEGRRILLSLTIEENLLMGAYQRRDREIASDLGRMYELFPNLARRRNDPGSVLSGGEQQMLAIGRALMARPRLLLMDEPSLGLSPLFVREVFNLIHSLNSSGLAILLVEQNTRMALQAAQWGYVLKLGRLALEADTEELMKSDDLARAYLGDNTTAKHRLHA
ncbi:ABC transporter ATP-binding protein [Bradyrhizobium sp. dw_78]|uniref:ABC transporter ATP-binding protein n=1 Tax=Bradyrhizobium sp. dw_78 TaxID=2719793 RepID=UPI001BD232B4|nr:ABC transporter ATP-binding protein [Bradyrhizobium sp. dw_78]